MTRELKKQFACGVRFGHVPRELNSIADWAGNVSRELKCNAELSQLCMEGHVAGPPPMLAKEAATKLQACTLAMLTHQ